MRARAPRSTPLRRRWNTVARARGRTLSLFAEDRTDFSASPVPPGADLERRAAPAPLPHLQIPARHEVLASDGVLRRLHGALAAAADRGPKDFADLLPAPGVGARTVAALALAAQVVHGTPSRFTDPARRSLAHGGKDGHPFPAPIRVYDETLRVRKQAAGQARLGRTEKLNTLRRLDAHARRLEQSARGLGFQSHIESERAQSRALGGRTVRHR